MTQTTTSGLSQLSARVPRLMTYFAIAYLVEGAATATGILDVPITFYFTDGLKLSLKETSFYIGLLGWPWTVKPLYGLISDCVPMFGYRRKTYLIAANLLSAAAFMGLAVATSAPAVVTLLLAITTGMAATSTLCGALVVEAGKVGGPQVTSKLLGQQSFWACIAKISGAVIGGLLVAYLSPLGAVHTAAVLCLLGPILIILFTPRLVDEQPAKTDLVQLKRGLGAMWSALRTRALWGVAIFLALWAFNPGFGAPLKVHMRDHLHFSKEFIGMLNGVAAAGAAIGALLYTKCLAHRYSVKRLAFCIIVLGAATQAAYVLMTGREMAIALAFLFGLMTQMAMINAHVIAADKCPGGAEGVMYAMLLSVNNLSHFGSQSVGGYLYDDVFHGHMEGLILLSAGLTLSCVLVLPIFKMSGQHHASGGH